MNKGIASKDKKLYDKKSDGEGMSFWHHLPRPIIGLAPMD